MSILGFFKKVGTAVKKVAVAVSDIFVKLFGSEAAKQFGEAALGLLKSELGQIAVLVVSQLSVTNLGTAVKREEAVLRILGAARSAGIEASESIVRLLVELVVTTLKGHVSPEGDPS